MRNPPSHTQGTTTPIPFREESAVSAAQLASTFAITLLLLGGVWLAARYARRKGWLDRWTGGNGPRAAALGVRVVSSHRVSRQTVIHTVADGERRYLLVESKANVSIAPLQEGLQDREAAHHEIK